MYITCYCYTRTHIQFLHFCWFLLVTVSPSQPSFPCFHSNGQMVEGADHSSVVQLIRGSGTEVNLVVVTVSEDEARRLEPEGAVGSVSAMDYFERRSIPISIPDTQKLKDGNGREYVVFNIYMSGRLVTTHRYREFDALNNNVSIFPITCGCGLKNSASCKCIYHNVTNGVFIVEKTVWGLHISQTSRETAIPT